MNKDMVIIDMGIFALKNKVKKSDKSKNRIAME